MATCLVQGSVRHSGTAMHRSLSAARGLPVLYWTLGLHHLSTLWCTWRRPAATLFSSRPGSAVVVVDVAQSLLLKWPRHLCSFLAKTGVVTRPPNREWERESTHIQIHTDRAVHWHSYTEQFTITSHYHHISLPSHLTISNMQTYRTVVPAIIKDIFVRILGPWRSVSHYNCTAEK